MSRDMILNMIVKSMTKEERMEIVAKVEAEIERKNDEILNDPTSNIFDVEKIKVDKIKRKYRRQYEIDRSNEDHVFARIGRDIAIYN